MGRLSEFFLRKFLLLKLEWKLFSRIFKSESKSNLFWREEFISFERLNE